mmetsp:Transcript_16059/g.31454  ORF Transcript_16059/g.31454 Transcript_16059/m.31454 type:complete len:531 (+) Transcript_16059:52-1644(+)|eukprot:CAMPEP_0175139006 /NCGR_PEP_ID=MMETSP0087-20121206/10660_1 /TAXON_ID=136419 /ORGANISM="Unknown Unknown, Strain D1" /LENGTH=530 /DNA_ID=CAMNT_0016421963 /DNA_START=90 /DNA_END=1682 /DNA_ORIENTATION=-
MRCITVVLGDATPFWRSVYIVLTSSIFYVGTYMWKNPIFVLPESYLNQTITPGSDMDVQTAFAFAQTFGYMSAKLPAVAIMSSSVFFKHRYLCIVAATVLSATFSGGGFMLFDVENGALPSLFGQVVCLGLAGLPASLIFCSVISYLEGRRQTEAMLSMLNLAVVLGGSCSRGFAKALLQAGVPVSSTPLVSSLTGLGIALPTLHLLTLAPKADTADVAQRCHRGPMAHKDRLAFFCRFCSGNLLMLLAYMVVMALRSFRDFYAQNIFTEALERSPSSTEYFFADIPGAVLSCGGLFAFVYVRQNKRALRYQFGMTIIGALCLATSTLLFDIGAISGYSWIMMTGASLYVSYLPMGSAMFDRILAASRTTGTVLFLAYTCDGLGYVGTVAVLLFQTETKNFKDSLLVMRIGSYAVGAVLVVCLGVSLVYFQMVLPPDDEQALSKHRLFGGGSWGKRNKYTAVGRLTGGVVAADIDDLTDPDRTGSESGSSEEDDIYDLKLASEASINQSSRSRKDKRKKQKAEKYGPLSL